MKLSIQNQDLELHASGSIFWENKKALFISDVHLGKIGHFRKNGLAIPKDAMYENFRRLDGVVALYKPEIIYFLGDLFHSDYNLEFLLFVDWIKNQNAKMVLIEGNHDIIDKKNYTNLGITVLEELTDFPFFLTHHPTSKENVINFCGHIHPGIKLKGKGKQFLKLSCFYVKENQIILPAFGMFTGNFYVTPSKNEQIYAIVDDEVVKIVLK
jgi:DNA ligase-associated metallophosphoesterase